MQFIVKPNSSDHWLLFKRLIRLHSSRALVIFAGLVLFSSGFMFGLMFAIDAPNSSDRASNVGNVVGCAQRSNGDSFDELNTYNDDKRLPPVIAWEHPDQYPPKDSPENDHHKSLPKQIDEPQIDSSFISSSSSLSPHVSSSSNSQVYLLTLITSSTKSRNRRDAIRNTWLKLVGNNSIKYYFALGGLGAEISSETLAELKREQEKFGDLLILPHVSDSYNALNKKVLDFFRWSQSKKNYRFLLKVDDDSFVRIDQLYNELKSKYDSDDRLYWGYFDGRAPIKKQGKWAEENWFLCDKYLPYALGAGYVLSSSLVKYIVTNAHLLQPYQSEDVTIGSWLSPLNINRVHEPRFDTEYKSRGCSNDFLITHPHRKAEKMSEMYDNLAQTGRLCKTEIMLKKAYFYNWKSPPSLCCNQNISFL
ncbi:beta-1,3-galactosyltransferase 6-like [Brevipalpus obovatus]|uniref:beta-1,3-galactosyltransferase 6-like n=1 Tax=Brevipalpus obovatus TaxID=246614 RepID=UPI003D9ED94B